MLCRFFSTVKKHGNRNGARAFIILRYNAFLNFDRSKAVCGAIRAIPIEFTQQRSVPQSGRCASVAVLGTAVEAHRSQSFEHIIKNKGHGNRNGARAFIILRYNAFLNFDRSKAVCGAIRAIPIEFTQQRSVPQSGRCASVAVLGTAVEAHRSQSFEHIIKNKGHGNRNGARAFIILRYNAFLNFDRSKAVCGAIRAVKLCRCIREHQQVCA